MSINLVMPSNRYILFCPFSSCLQSFPASWSFPAPQLKSINSSAFSFLYGPTLTSIHDYRKNHSFDYMDFCQKVISLLLNTLYRLVIAFLLVISWLQSLFTLILEPPKIKSATVSIFIPFICHEVMGLDAMIITAKLFYQTVHIYTGTLLVLSVCCPLC